MLRSICFDAPVLFCTQLQDGKRASITAVRHPVSRSISLNRNEMEAYYSLDRDDGIERDILFVAQSTEDLYERRLTKDELHAAMAALPDKRAKRIYADFLLGMSSSDIARAEGASWHSIDKSIKHGHAHLKKV